MCRVCLTRSNVTMYDLEDKSALSEENYLVKNGVFSIHEALEKVTASKVGELSILVLIFLFSGVFFRLVYMELFPDAFVLYVSAF